MRDNSHWGAHHFGALGRRTPLTHTRWSLLAAREVLRLARITASISLCELAPVSVPGPEREDLGFVVLRVEP